jgi:hypothetical protein
MLNNYSSVGSWAIWKKEGKTPKSNMDAVDLFDIKKNPKLLEFLHSKSILVGLNFSRTALNHIDFSNFHDPRPQSQDYKLRFALDQTSLKGSYMTDIFKNEIQVSSSVINFKIKKNKKLIVSHIEYLENEIQELQNPSPPLIYAFGNLAYEILNKHLSKYLYTKLIKLTHYAHYISKELYREEVLDKIENS